MNKDPAYKSIAPGSWQNIFPLGYWNIHLPAMTKEFAKRGVQNPIKDIIKDNVYLIEDANKPQLAHFYKVHYHQELTVDTVQSFGNVKLHKYRIKEVQDEKNQTN